MQSDKHRHPLAQRGPKGLLRYSGRPSHRQNCRRQHQACPLRSGNAPSFPAVSSGFAPFATRQAPSIVVTSTYRCSRWRRGKFVLEILGRAAQIGSWFNCKDLGFVALCRIFGHEERHLNRVYRAPREVSHRDVDSGTKHCAQWTTKSPVRSQIRTSSRR
jgi:hypothetical protein